MWILPEQVCCVAARTLTCRLFVYESALMATLRSVIVGALALWTTQFTQVVARATTRTLLGRV